VDGLLAWLATPQLRSLRRAFGIWLRRVFLRRRPGAVIPEIDDLREVKAMLAERWEQWTREWKQRGVEQGLRRSRGRPAPGALAHRPEFAGRGSPMTGCWRKGPA
jgi:hypothetical protein